MPITTAATSTPWSKGSPPTATCWRDAPFAAKVRPVQLGDFEMKKLALLAACAASLAFGGAARAGSYAIEHVTLIDGLGHAPQRDMTVEVEGDKIAAVTPSALAKPRGKAIDGHGKYLMPGLMDVHIHLHGGVDNKTDTNDSRPAALASYL